jgi:hypothetical protein
MRAEHKRPLVAFAAVSATSALLLSQALFAAPDEVDRDRPAASQSSTRSTGSPASSATPANGLAVEGVTASPSKAPVVVKAIGSPPTLMARDDAGPDASSGATQDPADTPPSNDAGSTPESEEPSSQPDPTSTGEPGPDSDSDSNSGSDSGEDPDEEEVPGDGDTSGHGPRSTPPHGPWSSPGVPPLSPGNNEPPSGSGTSTP